MSQQIIAELEELHTKVETAREEWSHYIEPLHAKQSRDQGIHTIDSAPTIPCSVATKVKDLDSVRSSLESRLQVLIPLHATPLPTIGSTAQLIRRHLPSHILGSETAKSILMCTFCAMDDSLRQYQESITMCEQAVRDRFDTIRKNYGAVLEVMNALGRYIDLAIKMRELKGAAEEMKEEGRNLAEANEALGTLSETLSECEFIAALAERQVLKYKQNCALVGVRVARQRMIFEFMEH